MPHTALPLSHWPESAAAQVQVVLTDIDDTLTENGRIVPEALAALHALKAAGLKVFAITGRPMGWVLPFVNTWPIDAFVAESGALAAYSEHGELRQIYTQDETTRARNAQHLAQVLEHIERTVPGAHRATDSPGRVTDISIDHAEEFPLSREGIAHTVALMEEAGLTATVSSIHINGWVGSHNKLSGARWIVQERLGWTLDDDLDRFVFVGDSTNDEPMFGHFPHSVGVANVLHFKDQLTVWPRYLCSESRGRGFAQVAQRLLQARGVAPA